MEIAEVVVCVRFYLISVSDSYIGFPFQKLVKMLHCNFFMWPPKMNDQPAFSCNDQVYFRFFSRVSDFSCIPSL